MHTEQIPPSPRRPAPKLSGGCSDEELTPDEAGKMQSQKKRKRVPRYGTRGATRKVGHFLHRLLPKHAIAYLIFLAFTFHPNHHRIILTGIPRLSRRKCSSLTPLLTAASCGQHSMIVFRIDVSTKIDGDSTHTHALKKKKWSLVLPFRDGCTRSQDTHAITPNAI